MAYLSPHLSLSLSLSTRLLSRPFPPLSQSLSLFLVGPFYGLDAIYERRRPRFANFFGPNSAKSKMWMMTVAANFQIFFFDEKRNLFFGNWPTDSRKEKTRDFYF